MNSQPPKSKLISPVRPYTKAVFLDSDGPLNDRFKGPRVYKERTGKDATDENFYVSNLPYMVTVLNYLDANGVLIVTGSQRMTYTDKYLKEFRAIKKELEKLKDETNLVPQIEKINKVISQFGGRPIPTNQPITYEQLMQILDKFIKKEEELIRLKESTLEGYDRDLSVDRNFLRPEHAETLVQKSELIEKNKTENINKKSKLPLLLGISAINEAKDIKLKDTYHVDDDGFYRDTTIGYTDENTKEHFQFILASRTYYDPGYFSFFDNQYLAHMLNIVLPLDPDLNWGVAMLKIDNTHLHDYAPKDHPKVSADLRALLKLNFALTQLTNAITSQSFPQEHLEGVIEANYQRLKVEIGESNPMLLLDYLTFVAKIAIEPPKPGADQQPLQLLNRFDDAKVEQLQNFNFILAKEKEVIEKCKQKGIPQSVLLRATLKIDEQDSEKLNNILLNKMFSFIHATLANQNLSLDSRQKLVRDKLIPSIHNMTSSRMLVLFGSKFLTGRDHTLESLFEKCGLQMFSVKRHSAISHEIIDALKNKLFELAKEENDAALFQRMITPGTEENTILHYHQDIAIFEERKQKDLTSHEKEVITYMAQKDIPLPDNATPAAKTFYIDEQKKAPVNLP